MPTQSSYDQLICDELLSLMNRARRIQQMLLLIGGVDPQIMLDFQTAVDDIRECSEQVKQWLTALPVERGEVLNQSAASRASRAERGIKGLVADYLSNSTGYSRSCKSPVMD